MLFNLEHDTGGRVTGYIVPDAFSMIPNVRIVGGGKELLVIQANEVREALIASGRHETGQCGFAIDTSVIPNLSEIKDLEVFEAETNVLVYRRSQPNAIQKKVLRFESHLFPLWTLDEALRPAFQYFSKGIENLGSETVAQLFLLNKVNSVYLSGRIQYKCYSHYIDAGFDTLILVQDPYEELAERLFVLSNVSRLTENQFGLRDSLGMRNAVAFAEDLLAEKSVDDEKGMRRKLKRMPADVAATLSNPLVRGITTSTPDEMPSRSAVASALSMLSVASVLGLRTESDLFLEAVSEFLNIPKTQLPPIPTFSKVPFLAATLRSIDEVADILEKDLEVYHNVKEACRKVSPMSGR